MATALEFIRDMQKRNATDVEVVRALQEEGFPLQEINDALNQSKIKQAVGEGMQPSIMLAPEQELPVPVPIKKRGGEIPSSMMSSQMMPAETEYPAYPPQYEYPAYSAGTAETASYQPYAGAAETGVDAETIEELTEEIVVEKINEFKKEVGDITEFKQDVASAMTVINDRVKRIESSMDKLQAALLGRVQDYGKDVKDLGTEMRALEGAFSKILNPLIDNVKELGMITEKLKAKRLGPEEAERISRRVEELKTMPEIKSRPIVRGLEAVKGIVHHAKKHKAKHVEHVKHIIHKKIERHHKKHIEHKIKAHNKKHVEHHAKPSHHKKNVEHKIIHHKHVEHKTHIEKAKPEHHKAVEHKLTHKPEHHKTIEHKPDKEESKLEYAVKHEIKHEPVHPTTHSATHIIHHIKTEEKPKHKEPTIKELLPAVPVHPLGIGKEEKHKEKKILKKKK